MLVSPLPIFLLLSVAIFSKIRIIPVMLFCVALIRLVFLLIPLMPVTMSAVVIGLVGGLMLRPILVIPPVLSRNSRRHYKYRTEEDGINSFMHLVAPFRLLGPLVETETKLVSFQICEHERARSSNRQGTSTSLILIGLAASAAHLGACTARRVSRRETMFVMLQSLIPKWPGALQRQVRRSFQLRSSNSGPSIFG